MIEVTDQSGTWKLSVDHLPVSLWNTAIVDSYECRRISARFECCHGIRYADLEGTLRYLDRLGWPPSFRPAIGTIGVLYNDILPPPALSCLSLPWLQMWRLSDVRKWRRKEMRKKCGGGVS